MGLSWMAWTLPTAAFFLFILLCLVGMAVWEWRSPGGAPRRGIIGLDTTRGDRLFITLLGSAFLFLGWLAVMGLAKTLTSVAAKPIAATMTRTASASGYELGLLAAAGSLTIIPGAFVIYFVRNYIAKGFALGRV